MKFRWPAVAGAIWLTCAPAGVAEPYEQDAGHLWNRLHAALFVRTLRDGTRVGEDRLDPLIYAESIDLLRGAGQAQAMKTLAEFNEAGDDALMDDPLRRAILQRDLWVVYDLSQGQGDEFAEARRKLRTAVAAAMKKVALTADQIARLPDSYANAVASGRFGRGYDAQKWEEAFLPPGLFANQVDWVRLAVADDLTAVTHVRDMQGRYVFDLFMNVPGGRAATLAYVKTLTQFPDPLVRGQLGPTDRRQVVRLNPRLPALPPGTQLALVRRTLLVDSQGKIRATALVESVQIRVYRPIPREHRGGGVGMVPDAGDQDVFEIVRRRADLFKRAGGGLAAVGRNEKDFPSTQFRAHVFDPIEFDQRQGRMPHAQDVILRECAACHGQSGLESFQTFNRFPSTDLSAKVPRLIPIDAHGAAATVETSVIEWKQTRPEWKALMDMWR